MPRGQRDHHVAAQRADPLVEIHLRRLLGVGLRVGIEALAGLLAEAPLGDQTAQDRGRREALAVTLLCALHALEHRVQVARVVPGERLLAVRVDRTLELARLARARFALLTGRRPSAIALKCTAEAIVGA